LRSAELGLGDAVHAVEGRYIDTNIFADNFGGDTRIAQPQRQRVWQRKFAKCALAGGEFMVHLTSVQQ
jgi:hypothetical protein